ncbi:MAG: 16S rRNA (guanine(527)-N(7))-methyltransferase RsmG [Rickettsiales bacterium]|nr:16S rRNA (guanine(527)-N(7))-methyltransferase RsmG [Rickettsiales bacterium]
MLHESDFPFPVSRETLTQLDVYVSTLLQWNKRINLIAQSTTPDLVKRHVLDSAQIYPLIPTQAERVIDLGSGAGFPGLILALLSDKEVHLIESDKRKTVFLQEVARLTGATAFIHCSRIEDVKDLQADVITARALAPLHLLLEVAEPFLHSSSICLFPKGENYIKELDEVRGWTYRKTIYPSTVHPGSAIVQLSHLQRDL